jgi:hypothetical protein
MVVAARELTLLLTANVEALAEALLGKPATSRKHELRWGRKGSLCLSTHGFYRGRFFDHERGEGGDALELVRRVKGGTVSEAMCWASDWLGIASVSRPERHGAPTIAAITERFVRDDTERISWARTIWNETLPMAGSAAEAYLRHRGIVLSDDVVDLRFHPSCPAGEGRRLPAMVALMRDVQSSEPRAIHRTFLKADGSAKDPAGKKMLGPALGTVIKLCDDADVTLGLGVAEGIETALSLRRYGWWPVWAAGSAGAIKTLPVLNGIETLTIFSDADDGGVGLEAARSCAIRWQTAGGSVQICKPPAGADWNDVVQRVGP